MEAGVDSCFPSPYGDSEINIYRPDCNLEKGLHYVATVPQGLAVENPSIESRVDIRNNWWGTTDPDSIQAWIFDAADDTTQTVIFDWYPYLDEPVANDRTTSGGLKRMFR